MKNLLLYLLISFLGMESSAQSKDYKSIELDLIAGFKAFENASYEDRYKRLSPKLKSRMKDVLSQQESFEYAFDSLAKHITVVVSPNQRVKLFSWDELTGGSFHDMTVLVQYKNDVDEVSTLYIDTNEDFDEIETPINAIQHSLYATSINDQTYYVALGWGTYGGGQHHGSILIFSIENGNFKICTTCIDERHVEIVASRMAKINLNYNSKKQTISFNEFDYIEDENVYAPTGKKIELKLKDGAFKEISN